MMDNQDIKRREKILVRLIIKACIRKKQRLEHIPDAENAMFANGPVNSMPHGLSVTKELDNKKIL